MLVTCMRRLLNYAYFYHFSQFVQFQLSNSERRFLNAVQTAESYNQLALEWMIDYGRLGDGFQYLTLHFLLS